MSILSLPHDTQIPTIFGVVDRPRLLGKLQTALEHRLTLICAPPGYGKTTVAAQFARWLPYPVAWHTVEERERDLPNLYHQCLAALESVAPGIRALGSVTGYAPNELAVLITDYLRDNVKGKIVYVLDDVHHLSGFPAAESWLRSLVTLLPPNCHLIMLSRALPDLPLTQMIARGEVLALGQEHLRFTPDEVSHLIYQVSGSAPSPTEAQELASRLEGWPAGTVLALRPLPLDLEQVLFQGGRGPEALFDQLAHSMLEAQPPRLRDFLLASSTLSRLTPELCSAVLHLPDAVYWLAEIQSRNFFLSRVSGGLAYHRLFRDFLQRQLQAANPELFTSLHTKAAQAFKDNNRLDEAFDHYMAAGLPEHAAAIGDRVARAYFAQGKLETLLSWGETLIQAHMQSPRLFYTCALILTDRYSYHHALSKLDEAQKGFQGRGDATGLVEVELQRAMIDFQQGKYSTAAAEAAPITRHPPESANLRGRALKILGLAHLFLGDVEAATKYLEEALPLFRTYSDAYALTNLLQDLEVAYTRLGRVREASACLQEVVALRRSLGSPSALALALNNLGYYYHQHGDYRQALQTFEEGLQVIAQVSDRRSQGYLLWSLGDLQRDLGGHEQALQLYNKALELGGNSEPHLKCGILVSASTLQRWRTNLDDAALLAQEASELASTHKIALEGVMAKAALWAVQARRGQPEEALTHLEGAVAQLRKQGGKIELVQLLGLCAHCELLRADSAAAARWLEAALKEAQQGVSLQPLVAELNHNTLLRAFVTEGGAKYATLNRALKRLREVRPRPRSGLAVPTDGKTFTPITYSLRVLTLGQEVIERDREPVPPSSWRSTSAKELFLYLLFTGPQTREQISLAFWPDTTPERVRSNFHTTLYRARQAVGENALIFNNTQYLISPEFELECDAHELERLAQQARLLSAHDPRAEDLWRRAVELYKGDFLPSLHADWTDSLRERFQEIYLEALIGLGTCARARGDLRKALEIYRRALEVDAYREDVHRAIMICYTEQGAKNKVLAHLRDLKKLLRRDLGVGPSPETIALAENLLS